jgi:DNA-binding transcriptional LysR family regulator
MQTLNWHDLRYVLAVARERALAPAARALGVNETTVSRRIARAEAALGSQLFHRAQGLLLLTETGQAAVQHAERMETEVVALGQRAGGADTQAAGSIRLTSIPLFVNRLLVPAIRDLATAHPLLRLELVAEPRNLSLTKGDADMALRMARPDKEQNLIARRICDLPYAVYGPAKKPRGALPWIAHEDSMAHLNHAAWIARAVREDQAGPPMLLVNDSEVIVHAIRAGLGKSILPRLIADREPGLRRIGGEAPVLKRELWLLMRPELQHLARIKAVTAWIERIARSQI